MNVTQQFRRTFGTTCLIACALLTLAIPSLAAPPAAAKIARLAGQARQALDAGNHGQAVDLYLAAWRLDEREAPLLLNAARAAHLGDRLDRAEELYRKFLALPAAPPQLQDKAREYLADIGLRRADRRAEEATLLADQRRHLESADAWRGAFRLAPSRPVYLLRAARAARLAGQMARAQADYEELLRLLDADAPERVDAEAELASLKSAAAPQPAAVQPTPTPVPVVTTPAPAAPKSAVPEPQVTASAVEESPSRVLPVTTTLVGAATAAVGAVLLFQALADEKDLDDRTWGRKDQDLPIDMSYDDAKNKAQEIADAKTLATAVLAGGGAVALGGVVWWAALPSRPSQTGQARAATGVMVGWRGAW